jgi:nucleotide-binding universal stress UspA family protein
MASPKRIVIAYDGTAGADAALDDLPRAGLPPKLDAVVLTVADPDVAARVSLRELVTAGRAGEAEKVGAESLRDVESAAGRTAAEGAARIAARFPGWTVSCDVRFGSPSSAIVLLADAARPDLVVVGARRIARPIRLLLGSVARKVVTECRCSVRVGRVARWRSEGPARIVVGHDGWDGGRAALEAASSRSWPSGSEIRVVSVSPLLLHGAFSAEFPIPDEWRDSPHETGAGAMRAALEQDAAAARRPGLKVSVEMDHGDARRTLLRIARSWRADCVYVGARRLGRMERFLLGSVSAAIAERAKCSVEVVRA